MGIEHQVNAGHQVGAGDHMGTGHGKLLLFGEHAVVHGYPAVGVGCNLYTSFMFKTDAFPHPLSEDIHRDSGHCTISAAGRSLPVYGVEHGDRELLESAVARGLAAGEPSSRLPDEATTILVDSSVPRGVGLGSSAALCAAIADAIYPPGAKAVQSGVSRHEALAALAHEIEHLYHGRPSGVDTALSVYGGIRAFSHGGGHAGARRGEREAADPGARRGDRQAADPRARRGEREAADPGASSGTGRRSWPLHPAGDSPITLVYGYVRRSADTRTLVARVSEALARGDRDALERVAELGGLSHEAIAEIDARKPDGKLLGSLAWRAQAALSALGLSTPALEMVLAAGRRAGARGGKLSGAGGGGAWFLLFDDPEHAEAGRAVLHDEVPDVPVFTMPLVPAGQT